MKKNLLFVAAISVSVALASCAGGGETATEESTTPEEVVVESNTWTIDPAASSVRWEGGTAGAQVYSHFGTIGVQSGMVTTEGGVTTFKSETFNINRADFNVKYGSKSFFDDLQDKFIDDLIAMSFEVKTKA